MNNGYPKKNLGYLLIGNKRLFYYMFLIPIYGYPKFILGYSLFIYGYPKIHFWII